MEKYIVLLTILGIVFMFMFSNRRYDIIALIALLFLGVLKILSPTELFMGFSHPAIITLASVLVISNALLETGVIDIIVKFLTRKGASTRIIIIKLMLITTFFSAFMNNIGALALILPVAMKIAKERDEKPSLILMPISFSSLLGGMLTEIGTPPNLIVSAYRETVTGHGFGFFDFSMVALPVVSIGLLFMILLAKLLLPKNRESKDSFKPLDTYLSEVEVVDGSNLIGSHIMDIHLIHKLNFQVLSIIRGSEKIPAPNPREIIQRGDVLIIKGYPEELKEFTEKTGVRLKGTKTSFDAIDSDLKNSDTALVRIVLKNDSPLIGRTAAETKLRNRYMVNLIAVSRKGVSTIQSLKDFRFRMGDVLLIQAPQVLMHDTLQKLSALPLATGTISSVDFAPKWQKNTLVALFGLAILLTTIGIFPVEISFSVVAALCVFLKMITPRSFYDSIEWPSIILLGSLLPIGIAFEKTGGALEIANLLLKLGENLSTPWMIASLMALTMLLANFISTSASAVLMGPIAISVSKSLDLPVDPFLIAVAISASSSFLTPIGHQTNLLIMGPGGYKFKDYWPLGLPLSLLVIATSIPLIMYFWL